MTLGISSYTFGWAAAEGAMNVHALLDFAQAEGVTVVQVCDNLPLIELPAPQLEAVIGRAHDAGITLELGTRGLTPENLDAHIALAELMNAPLLRLVMDGPSYHPTVGVACAILRDALPRLSGTQVILGIENHDRFPARVLRRLMDDLNHPQVGICLDTANSLGAGEGIEHILEHLAPVTVNLHLKDFQIERVPYLQGLVVNGRPAGQGMLDIPPVIKRVAQGGGCRSAILELWVPPEASIEATLAKERRWAQESLHYLRPLLDAAA